MKLLAYGLSMSLDYGQRLLQCHRAPQALTNTLQNYWQMLCLGIALEPANRRRSFQKKLSSGRQTIVIDSQMAIEGLAELIQRLLIIDGASRGPRDDRKIHRPLYLHSDAWGF